MCLECDGATAATPHGCAASGSCRQGGLTFRPLLATVVCQALLSTLAAAQLGSLVTFDGLDDLTVLDSQYAGLSFRNVVV